MLSLEELKKEIDLINEINWDLGPEEAVKLYLEWGNTDWGSGKYTIRSKDDYSVYFVINTWHEPVVYLIRRNSEGAEELATIDIPDSMKRRYMESIGNLKGVYPVEGEIRQWLEKNIYHA